MTRPHDPAGRVARGGRDARSSQRIEEVVNTVEGIDELRSVSAPGSRSFIVDTSTSNRDIDIAAQDVRDRVAGVLRDLPPDVDPPMIAKFDNDSIAGR